MAIASKDGAARVQPTARNAVVNSAKVFLSESLLGKEIWNHSTSCFSFQSFQERFPKSFFFFAASDTRFPFCFLLFVV